jgi:hypothetical protein
MANKGIVIGERPCADAESWVQRGDRHVAAGAKSTRYTARLTVDVTPALRARIKCAAIDAEMTASELLRRLLEREFPTEREP